MSIQKKSLISALKTTKKANVASVSPEGVKGEKQASMGGSRAVKFAGAKTVKFAGAKTVKFGSIKGARNA
jgi:hypothetical protein